MQFAHISGHRCNSKRHNISNCSYSRICIVYHFVGIHRINRAKSFVSSIVAHVHWIISSGSFSATDNYIYFYSYILFNLIPTTIDILVAVVFFVVYFNVSFGLIAFISTIIYIGLYMSTIRNSISFSAITIIITECRTSYRRSMEQYDLNARSIAVESLMNHETVRSFHISTHSRTYRFQMIQYNGEQFEIERYRSAIANYQHSEWQSSASLSLLHVMQNGVIAIALFIGVWLLTLRIATESIRLTSSWTTGDVVLFVIYLLQLYSPLNFFGTIYR